MILLKYLKLIRLELIRK